MVVVRGRVVYNFIKYIWCQCQPLQEQVDGFCASDGISCQGGEVFEFCYIFIDQGETESVGF